MCSILSQFRHDVYDWFPHRADALMDLLDAASSTPGARSVVELSENALFRRQYGSVHDAIEQLCVPHGETAGLRERQHLEQALVRLLVPYLPRPQRHFWLLGIDVTPAARPYARTLSDRGYVYRPNPVKGVKPITIGHQYSVVVLFPEKHAPDDPPWVIPLLVNRVSTAETKRAAGLAQIGRLCEDATLPFHRDITVTVADSDYSAVRFLGGVVAYPNHVTVARFAGNRTVYRQPPPPPKARGKGHPTWFGAPMSLQDPATWDEPDEVTETTFTTRKGKVYSAHIEGWREMLVRGKRGLPMHTYPFTLVRIRVLNSKGQPVFRRPLWLIVFGERRNELTLGDIWEAYHQRYDVEHFFRFGTQRLLLDAYQTPETAHEENWWTIVQLAYLQLWFAREEAGSLPRSWERYLPRFRKARTDSPESPSTPSTSDSVDVIPDTTTSTSTPLSEDHTKNSGVPSPSDVQRDCGRILQQIGTPARPPKPRGKAPGRRAGERLVLRVQLPIIKKSVKTLQQQRAP